MGKKSSRYIVLALVIGLGVVGFQKTFAQQRADDGLVCSSGTPVGLFQCAYLSTPGFSVTCPASRPKQYLIYPSPQQGPSIVECKTEAAIAALGSTYECSRTNGEKYSVTIGLYCGQGDTPVSCPAGYSALGQACISQSSSPSSMSPQQAVSMSMTCRMSSGTTYTNPVSQGCYGSDTAVSCPSGYSASGTKCVASSASPSPSPSPSSSSSSSSIWCVSGVPGAFTEIKRTSCYSTMQTKTLGIRCDSEGAVMHRSSDGYDSCISSSSLGSEKACTFTNAAGNSVTLYATSCPDSSSASSSPSLSSNKCPRKPDPSNGNANPDPIPAGSKAKFILLSHTWSCHFISDQSAGSCTAKTSPRDGTKIDPCKFGEETISCPAGDTAYRDGNYLRCAPLITQGGEQPQIGTTTPEATLPVNPETELQSNLVLLTPDRLQEFTEESCNAYRKDVVRNVLPQALAYLNFGEKLPLQAGAKDTTSLKQLGDDLKRGAEGYRSVLKLTKNFECKKEYVEKLDLAINELNLKHFGALKQDYAILNQENPEKNQLFGVRDDLSRCGALFEQIQNDPKKVDQFREFRASYQELKKMYDEEISKDQDAFLGIEIAEFAQKVSTLRKECELKLKSKAQVSDSKKSPSSTLKKSTLKKKFKKALRETKKSKLRLPLKKGSKKTGAKLKSEKK